MNKILVTGAGGYLGLKIVSELVNKEYVESVLGIARREQSFVHEKVSWFIADLQDQEYKGVFDTYAPDVVIHTAWDMDSQENQEIAERVLKLALEKESVKKIIYLSSVVVYGTREKNNFCDEKDPLVDGVRGPYGIQKVATEKALQSMYKQNPRGIEISVLRPVGVYEVLPKLMDINRVVPFPSPHPIFRQFLHTQDLVESVIFLIQNTQQEGITIYNLAPQPSYLKVFYAPTWLVTLFFAVLWRLFKYKRSAPGKWRIFLHPPLVDGSKGRGLLSGEYRNIPFK